MKPVLYEANTTEFTTNGLGTLGDAISCEVTEVRNGAYELEMEYPIDGIHMEDITYSRIVYAIPADGKSEQPFRIYSISKPIDGVVTVKAEHISYQLSHIPCGAFTASNVVQALQGLKSNAYENCPFTFWTDKATQAIYRQDVPASIRSRLGGTQGSILDTYGGELEWDTYNVKLHNNRGSNSGATLRYGKNITDIKQEENISNTITGVVPYYKNEDTLVTLPEHAVYSQNASLYPYHRTIVVDFSSSFNTAPSVEMLRARAVSYINQNGIGIPKVSIKVSFVPLWQTEEYKDIASLERVNLCDTVSVEFEKLGISAQAKVIKTVYDVLLERYTSIEIGEATSRMSSQVSQLQVASENQVTLTDMERAINSATNMITGGAGGYVVMKHNADNEPEEILIMDTPDTSTAVNVIRMNKNGIGFSNTGVNGTYTTAWTINGAFVADFIASGTLSAIDINGVNISGSTITGTSITGGSVTGATIYSEGVRQYGNGSISINGCNTDIEKSGSTLHIDPWEIRWYFPGSSVEDVLYLNDDYTVKLGGGIGCSGVHISKSWSGLIVDDFFEQDGTVIQLSGQTGGITCKTLSVSGTKSRVADTKNYGERLLYCYETPTPYFGDLGEGKTDESGKCYVFLDDTFDETIEGKYQVFLQAYGEGRLYVSERTSAYFVVEGEPNTSFGWELKAPQKGYSLHRLEPFEQGEQEERENVLDSTYRYLNEQLFNVEGVSYEEH